MFVLIDFFLYFGIFTSNLIFHEAVAFLSQQVDSCSLSSITTLVGERHLASGFKHWSWFYSLSYAKHVDPCPLWKSQFLATTLTSWYRRKMNQNPSCCGFKSCSVMHFSFCPHWCYSVFESPCVVSIFSFYILPVILCV